MALFQIEIHTAKKINRPVCVDGSNGKIEVRLFIFYNLLKQSNFDFINQRSGDVSIGSELILVYSLYKHTYTIRSDNVECTNYKKMCSSFIKTHVHS